jgi:PIN domain nuclease of toxin-antitoxin system
VSGVLLDTHVLVWWAADPDRLSGVARQALEAADQIAVSAASAWELALLVDAGRLALDRPVERWVQDVAAHDRVRLLPIDTATATAAAALGRRGFHRDPADRFLYATAQRQRLPLVTKDAPIRSFAAADRAVQTVW